MELKLKKVPASCRDILAVLLSARMFNMNTVQGGWMTTSTLLSMGARTTCIHKRISELIRLGWVEKRESPIHKGRRLYRALPDVEEVSGGNGKEAEDGRRDVRTAAAQS